MLERQLEYERVRLEAESRKAYLELQEKVMLQIIELKNVKYVFTGETSKPISTLSLINSSSIGISSIQYFKPVRTSRCN